MVHTPFNLKCNGMVSYISLWWEYKKKFLQVLSCFYVNLRHLTTIKTSELRGKLFLSIENSIFQMRPIQSPSPLSLKSSENLQWMEYDRI